MLLLTFLALNLALLPNVSQDVTVGLGDSRTVAFEKSFESAMARSKRENKLVFLKPIYGGVDAAGAKDHREGCW